MTVIDAITVILGAVMFVMPFVRFATAIPPVALGMMTATIVVFDGFRSSTRYGYSALYFILYYTIMPWTDAAMMADTVMLQEAASYATCLIR